MEPKPDKSSSYKTGSKILHDGDTKKSSSSSSSNSKKRKESKRTATNSVEKSLEENDTERPSSVNSAESNCAICLEPLQNASFSDGCSHTFCFTCLQEWSKVKAECPLCKKRFTYIMYNLKNDTYDKFFIGSKTSTYLNFFRTEQHRFRYPTTMTAPRIMERNHMTYHQESYQSQIASHRMRFAPHSVNLYSSAQIIRLPCPFRRRVYEQDLWVKTPLNVRTRLANPDFYQRNPACTHRLIPWLNRELVSFLHDTGALIAFILELILSLVVRYHIRSQEFLCHVEPYLGRYTHHFIHEFYSYAISPYDMENYDTRADYGLAPHSTDDTERSSPDSDVIALFTQENNSLPRPNRERKQKMRKQALKHLKMILKKSNGNSWESYLSPACSTFVSSGWGTSPEPSTSGSRPSNYFSLDRISSHCVSISDEEKDEDEIQVVDVIKPLIECTPEIVDLSSDDEVPATVIDVSSGEENFSSVCSPSRTTPPLAALSINDASTDIEVLLEYEPSPNGDISTHSETSTEKDVDVVEEQNQGEEQHSSSATEELESDALNEEGKKPKLASAIVIPWKTESGSSCKPWTAESESLCRPKATESESSLKVHVPRLKRRRLSSSLDDSSSDSSDSDRSSSRKLKLQSVVACFEINRKACRHGSSHHHSSRKKHKDKKKKKYKRIRRHRNRIYSGSES